MFNLSKMTKNFIMEQSAKDVNVQPVKDEEIRDKIEEEKRNKEEELMKMCIMTNMMTQ